MGCYDFMEDDFEDIADGDDGDLISLDFNSIAPFLVDKCRKSIIINGNSFEMILAKLNKQLTDEDKQGSALILMKLREFDNANQCTEIGWKINKIFCKDSLLVFGAKKFRKNIKNPGKYSHKFKVYLYD